MTLTDKEKLEEIRKLMSIGDGTEEERREQIYRILQKKKKKIVKILTDKEKLEEIEKIISIDMTDEDRFDQICRILDDLDRITGGEIDLFPEATLRGQIVDHRGIPIDVPKEVKEEFSEEGWKKRFEQWIKEDEEEKKEEEEKKKERIKTGELSKCVYCANYFEELFECDYCKDSYCEEHRLAAVHICGKILKRRRGKKGWFLK